MTETDANPETRALAWIDDHPTTHDAGLAERDAALEQLAGWFESEADSSHGGWADAARTAADRIRAVVAGEVACSQCQEQPAEEHGMCSSCLHDARRSGWEPPATEPPPMTCGDPEPHEPHRKLGDGRPCDGVDPAPPDLVGRMRQVLEAAAARLVYGNAEQLERAAAEMQREDQLVEQHATALRRAIGPALRNAETYGTGWIRVDARCAPDQPVAEVFDWTISSPNPTTITIHDHPGDRPMTDDRPTLADRAAAASAATPAATETEHLEAGAFARSVLTEQLEQARHDRDGTLDMLETYQEQFEAEQLRVRSLELALEDLGDAAKRTADLERVVVGPEPVLSDPGRGAER